MPQNECLAVSYRCNNDVIGKKMPYLINSEACFQSSASKIFSKRNGKRKEPVPAVDEVEGEAEGAKMIREAAGEGPRRAGGGIIQDIASRPRVSIVKERR